MQYLIKKAKKIRLKVIENLSRNEVELNLEKPIISFTFDDFPKTAFTEGAVVLEKYNVRGTYYAAFGLIDTVYDIGEAFSLRDVKELIERGHNIGCHTFSHVSLMNYFTLRKPHVGLKKFREDIARNNDEYVNINSSENLNHFSYPHGIISIKAKKVCSKIFKTCRSTIEGINTRTIDLNLLKANYLYSARKSIGDIISLINENVYQRGWLIFYTHDICNNPSPWGCTVEFFDEIVKKASETSEVLTIEEAHQRICS